MNNIMSFLNESWLLAFGYTLIHSLWQGLFIATIVYIILRFLPKKSAHIRYTVTSIGLLVIALAAAVTFYMEATSLNSMGTSSGTQSEIYFINQADNALFTPTISYGIEQFIHQNTVWLFVLWIAGMLLSVSRLFVGWYYINQLRSNAIPITNEWFDAFQMLAQKLSMSRLVTLAESTALQAPVAIGYLKPLVLVPTGMFAGLTPTEVETILLHELAHIKRHDYLINIFQLLIESILFFNPFVWILSNIIRQEREHCCDDMVTKHGNALAYAYALTRLEEVRLSKNTMVLSLASTKHQLLNRIKRIMETSVKNYSYRDRIIPIMLLITGLACASFLTLQSVNKKPEKMIGTIAPDTVKPKKSEKSATYSKQSTTRIGEDGKSHEEVVENFEGDEELRLLLQDDFDSNFDFPIPPIPAFPDVSMLHDFKIMIPPYPHMDALDTFPPGAFHWNHDGNWKEFSEEFEKRFKEKFGDFYAKNGEEIEKMMREMESRFNHDWSNQMEEAMRRQEEAMERLNHKDWKREHEEAARKMKESMRDLELDMKELDENLKELDKNMKAFQNEAAEQLVKDGYFEKGEKVKDIRWDNDGDMAFNGKKIKDKDKEKYKKIYKKYFKDKGNFRYRE
jgi:bla regulator protein blaR1